MQEGHDGLQRLLMEDTGVNFRFMPPPVYRRCPGFENSMLCHPASVDSIPTSLGQGDHVSMGSRSAIKLLAVTKNVAYVLASHRVLHPCIPQLHQDYEVCNDLEICTDMQR